MKRKYEKRFKDYTGFKFSRWTVLRLSDKSLSGDRKWDCRCECGTVRPVAAGNLIGGITKSCGCWAREVSSQNGKNNKTHGLCGTPIYKAWDCMKQRCYIPTTPCFKIYGGRGIRICSWILKSPKNLLILVGHRPSKKFSIDRIETNSNYSCGKCKECLKNGWKMNLRWATQKQQCRNRRANVFVTVMGKTKTLSEWAIQTGLSRTTIGKRFQRGEIGVALIAPSHECKKYKPE